METLGKKDSRTRKKKDDDDDDDEMELELGATDEAAIDGKVNEYLAKLEKEKPNIFMKANVSQKVQAYREQLRKTELERIKLNKRKEKRDKKSKKEKDELEKKKKVEQEKKNKKKRSR